MKTDTRLFISHHEGDRTSEDATELFEDIERKRNPDSQIPLYISDEWDPFSEALLNVYGNLKQPSYKGIGRRPNPVLVPKEDLKYAQVCKKREHGSIVGMVKHVVFGDLNDILKILGADSMVKSALPILNVLISQIVDFLQAWYNFVKPHKSLRVLQMDGNRKWMQRTPVMAEGLTDHIWKLEELLMFRIPVQ